MSDMHFASLWEAIADHQPQAPALICGDTVRSWREYDERAACLASLLDEHDIGRNTKVGLYLHNCNEYVEAQYAVFKVGATPVNVNYRYKADELIYLLDNADAQALVYQACYADRIREIKASLPNLKLLICVDDGTQASFDGEVDGAGNSAVEGAVEYEAQVSERAPLPRRPHDFHEIYMLYTGGTTGMPKGVMYHNGDFASRLLAMFSDPLGMPPVTDPADVVKVVTALAAADMTPVSLPACPLMHGTGMWLGTILPLMMGGSVVTIPKLGLDPDLIWSTVARHGVTDLVIVGDAFARPLCDALVGARERGSAYDIASMRQIISSGVMWSAEIKEGLLAEHPFTLVDTMGSTEGSMGSSTASRESGVAPTAKFEIGEGVRVIAEDGSDVVPGSGAQGMVATSGLVPIGYFKDEEKSAATFREIDGERFSFPGDFATVEADGTITLLGRGSQCINTAGEKVFPEEVEEVIKQHESVADCLVVGLADERFGQRVVALAAVGEEHPSSQALIDQITDFARQRLSGYKVPRRLALLPMVQRAPNGKADYKWARSKAEELFTG